VLVSAVLLFAGCTTLYVKAPSGSTVALMANEPTTVKMEFRQVTLLWGLLPISNVPFNTANWAKQVNLGELRVKTYYKWYEFIWNFVTLGLVHTNSILLEGNPPELEP